MDNTQTFIKPIKKILLPEDVEKLKQSEFLQHYLQFIVSMQKSVQGHKMRCKESRGSEGEEKLSPVIKYLEHLSQLLVETPCSEQPQRFGNKSFRVWLEKVWEYTNSWLQDNLLPEDLKEARIELAEYLKESYGSHQRIDYGTGHELNFKLNMFQEKDMRFLTQNIFYKYIDLMREVQMAYKLEPAGSHGVWGLDDYHFLPFLFGASELINNPDIPLPADIIDLKLLTTFKQDYMYANCLQFIKEVKTGHFHEHSPILYDISGTANWGKVAIGLVKMYQAEVLLKFPVIKHTSFGSLISFP